MRLHATQPDRYLAVYHSDQLVLVYLPQPGTLYGAVRNHGRALLETCVVSGRIMSIQHQLSLLSLITAARDVDDLARRLVATDHELLPTPAASIAWAMR